MILSNRLHADRRTWWQNTLKTESVYFNASWGEKMKQKLFYIKESRNWNWSNEPKRSCHQSRHLPAHLQHFLFFLPFLYSKPPLFHLSFLRPFPSISSKDINTSLQLASQRADRQGANMMHTGEISSERSWCYIICSSLTPTDSAEIQDTGSLAPAPLRSNKLQPQHTFQKYFVYSAHGLKT